MLPCKSSGSIHLALLLVFGIFLSTMDYTFWHNLHYAKNNSCYTWCLHPHTCWRKRNRYWLTAISWQTWNYALRLIKWSRYKCWLRKRECKHHVRHRKTALIQCGFTGHISSRQNHEREQQESRWTWLVCKKQIVHLKTYYCKSRLAGWTKSCWV